MLDQLHLALAMYLTTADN